MTEIDPSAPHQHFTSGHYDKAHDQLQKLLKPFEGKPDELKILHNIAVNNFYLSGCTEPQKILDELFKVRKSVEEKRQEDSVFAECEGITSYNQAVIYCQLKQYDLALGVLETVFQTIDHYVEDSLAIKICFLFIDVCLVLKNKEQATVVLNYLEKRFAIGDGGDPKKELNSDKKFKPLPPNFKYVLHLCKAKLHLLNKTLKQSKRELKLAMSVHQTLMSIFLKANSEYLRQNYVKSMKLLNSINQKNTIPDKSVAPMYFNNLGCMHFKLKKYNTAAFYFTKALKESDQHIKSTEKWNIAAASKSRKWEILQNLGYQMLVTGHPEMAMKCYQECCQLFYKSPRIWLRLAECCSALYQQKVKEDPLFSDSSSFAIRKIIGNSSTKKILLSTTSTTSASAVELLEYGLKCIKNALSLLLLQNQQKKNPESSQSQLELSNSSTTTPLTSDQDETWGMTCACYTVGAFLALRLPDPTQCVFFARTLFNLAENSSKKIPSNYRFPLSMYAAQSLCQLNRPSEAAQYLMNAVQLSESVTIGNLMSQSHTFPVDSQFQQNPQYLVLINMVIVHLMKDDVNQAQQCLNQALTINSTFPAGILLQVFMELKKGNTETAMNLLKLSTSSHSQT